MVTARGVYYDLTESCYKTKFDKIEFYFSSEKYLTMFLSKRDEYLKNETNKLRVKYGCVIIADYMILLSLYKKIEKRGFYVKYNDEVINDYMCNMDLLIR